MKRIKERTKEEFERTAEKVMHWIGSPSAIIAHTILFIVFFMLPLFGVSTENMLLILTTAVSLEAIYLAIFIQIAVNRNTEDIEEIQEDIEGIEEDVDEIQKDVDEIQEDIEESESDRAERLHRERGERALTNIQHTLTKLQIEIENLKKS